MPAFGTFPFGTSLWNGGKSNLTSYPTDLAVFNGFSLADNVNTFITSRPDSMAARDLIEYKIPRTHGFTTVTGYFSKKLIDIQGIVQNATPDGLNAFLDTMRQALQTVNGTLDITEYGVVRRYIATLSNPEGLFANRQRYHVTYCPYHAMFVVSPAFATDRGYTSLSQTVSASPTTITFAVGGTMSALPVISLNFSSASSVTSINITNNTTGEQIQFSGSLSASDLLVFDSEQKTVQKNAVDASFIGSFPTVLPGNNLVQLTINGTFSCIVTCKAKATYL